MKKMLYLSAAAILAFATAASAQGDRRDDRGGAQHPAPQGHAAPPPHAQPQHASAPERRAAPRPHAEHPSNNNRGADSRSDHGNTRAALSNNARSNSANAHANNTRSPNTNGHARPNPSYAQYHRNITAPRRYQAAGYNRPSGWYAHRWTYGQFLPSLFWAPNFWLNDYIDFGLMPPPPGTVWVRDDSDALLIDRYTGEVIEVEYNVFY
jgi:Ni/Co efflux regulator RcnB